MARRKDYEIPASKNLRRSSPVAAAPKSSERTMIPPQLLTIHVPKQKKPSPQASRAEHPRRSLVLPEEIVLGGPDPYPRKPPESIEIKGSAVPPLIVVVGKNSAPQNIPQVIHCLEMPQLAGVKSAEPSSEKSEQIDGEKKQSARQESPLKQTSKEEAKLPSLVSTASSNSDSDNLKEFKSIFSSYSSGDFFLDKESHYPSLKKSAPLVSAASSSEFTAKYLADSSAYYGGMSRANPNSATIGIASLNESKNPRKFDKPNDSMDRTAVKKNSSVSSSNTTPVIRGGQPAPLFQERNPTPDPTVKASPTTSNKISVLPDFSGQAKRHSAANTASSNWPSRHRQNDPLHQSWPSPINSTTTRYPRARRDRSPPPPQWLGVTGAPEDWIHATQPDQTQQVSRKIAQEHKQHLNNVKDRMSHSERYHY